MTDLDGNFLAAIESKCEWLQSDAKQMIHFMEKLQRRRNFLTKVEDGLDRAERDLKDALETVRAARKLYLEKSTT
jgi:hypothetical protein